MQLEEPEQVALGIIGTLCILGVLGSITVSITESFVVIGVSTVVFLLVLSLMHLWPRWMKRLADRHKRLNHEIFAKHWAEAVRNVDHNHHGLVPHYRDNKKPGVFVPSPETPFADGDKN